MGYSILELVLRRLREEGFAAEAAYPGQKFPQIEGTVAAVHIEKVDRANLTVTIEVNVLCPGAMGGTQCELEALRVTEILRWSGAVAVQHGCTYDGVAQVYCVRVTAAYTGVTEAQSCTLWPGFYCYVGDVLHHNAVGFAAEESREGQLEYGMGEELPLGIGGGKQGWTIQLEEQIPAGTAEPREQEEPFVLQLLLSDSMEIYTGCRWTSIRREFDKGGIHRIRRGFALGKEVSPNGLNAI